MRTFPRVDAPGPGQSGYELARALKEPSLYITRREVSPPLCIPDHVELCEVAFPDPVAMPPGRVGALLATPIKAAAYGIFLAGSVKHIRRFKPDVLIAQSLPALLTGAVGSYLQGIPWAFSFRGTEIKRAVHPPLRQLIARADYLFYVSEAMEPVLAQHFPDIPRLYTPSGVDLELFGRERRTERGPRLLTVGRFSWQKGYDTLARALPRVFEQAPELQLTMVGRGPEQTDFEKLAQSLGVEKKIEIIPQLGREEIAQLLSSSAIMLLPSVSEGLPKVILEAMATGTPVIASDIGSCREVLGPGGTTVTAGDPEQLAEAIIQLWRNSERRAQMGRAGRQRATAFSWNESSSRIQRALESMLAQHSTPGAGH